MNPFKKQDTFKVILKSRLPNIRLRLEEMVEVLIKINHVIDPMKMKLVEIDERDIESDHTYISLESESKYDYISLEKITFLVTKITEVVTPLGFDILVAAGGGGQERDEPRKDPSWRPSNID